MHPEDWPNCLMTLEFTHNNWRHADRTHTPFKLILGNNPISITITFQNTKYPTIKEKLKQMVQEREEALAAHKLAKTWMANRRQSQFTPFKEGQKVWLDNWNIITGYHKKINPKHDGPFEIEEVQWGTKPFKWFLKLNYFLNKSRMTEPNKFKFGTVVEYHVPNKL